jgi:hypothetical protein
MKAYVILGTAASGVYEIRDDHVHVLFACKDVRPMAFVKKRGG